MPVDAVMEVIDKERNEVFDRAIRIERDESNRPGTSLEGLAALQPVRPGGVVTAGNASQLSDGASASVVMDAAMVERQGIAPLGRYVGMTVAAPGPTRWESVRSLRSPSCSTASA